MRELDFKVPSGCAVSGIINQTGKCFSGGAVTQSIALMHDRANGLGGGLAAYGIYPDLKDYYAFHMLFDNAKAQSATQEYFAKYFEVRLAEPIPTRPSATFSDAPLVWRYFVTPKMADGYEDTDDYVVRSVMFINATLEGAYVISSGKNMGVFKGVGYPEDISEFFRLDEYTGYCWTAHGRFPTNSVGWWGGAHPFGLLDWSVVHNGEVSSYGTNKRFLSGFGYECTLSTDTEVVAYLIDLLARKHKLSLDMVAKVLASPFWSAIERMPENERETARAIRIVYGGALLNGPFSILVGFTGGLFALNDRIKLRPLTAGVKGDTLYVASEESAIREICPDPEKVWSPRAGEPIIGTVRKVKNGVKPVGTRISN